MKLKDTIPGMLSDDPKECLIAEVQQAYIRMNQLEDLIERFEKDGDASCLPTHIRIIKAHHKTLHNYFSLLLTRAVDEGITVHLE